MEVIDLPIKSSTTNSPIEAADETAAASVVNLASFVYSCSVN